MSFTVEFSGARTDVGAVEFFSPPSSFQAVDQRLTSPELLRVVKSLEPGAFLLSRPDFRDLDRSNVQAQFIQGHELEFTRQNSAHEVVFGQINLTSEGDRQRTELVALKPFDDDVKKAVHEYAVLEYINITGFKRAQRPVLALHALGFHRDPINGGIDLITEYDESVISYDSLFWNYERLPTPAEAAKALGRCTFALAALHVVRLTHGDARVRNLASDNRGVRFIDMEDSLSFPLNADNNQGYDETGTRELIERDISTFFGSLNAGLDPGFVEEMPDYTDIVMQRCAPAYARHVRHHTSRVPETARLTEEEVATLYLTA